MSPGGETYEELIEHLEKLEVSIPGEVVEEDKPKVTFYEKDARILRKERTHDKRARDKSRSSGPKSCGICRMMKGEDHLAWKTYNTEDCRSKKYYTEIMSDSSDMPSSDYKK